MIFGNDEPNTFYKTEFVKPKYLVLVTDTRSDRSEIYTFNDENEISKNIKTLSKYFKTRLFILTTGKNETGFVDYYTDCILKI